MAEAKWYVVHTYSGYENKVKANIEKTIENNKHLAEQILEVRVPMEEVIEVKNGVKKTVQRKLFPGYVLLNMDTPVRSSPALAIHPSTGFHLLFLLPVTSISGICSATIHNAPLSRNCSVRRTGSASPPCQ